MKRETEPLILPPGSDLPAAHEPFSWRSGPMLDDAQQKIFDVRLASLMALRPILLDLVQACALLDDRTKNSGFTKVSFQDEKTSHVIRLVFPAFYETDQRPGLIVDKEHACPQGWFNLHLACYAAGHSSRYDIEAESFEDMTAQYRELLRSLAQYEVEKIESWDRDCEDEPVEVIDTRDPDIIAAENNIDRAATRQAVADIEEARNKLHDVLGRLAVAANTPALPAKPRVPGLRGPG